MPNVGYIYNISLLMNKNNSSIICCMMVGKKTNRIEEYSPYD